MENEAHTELESPPATYSSTLFDRIPRWRCEKVRARILDYSEIALSVLDGFYDEHTDEDSRDALREISGALAEIPFILSDRAKGGDHIVTRIKPLRD